MSRDLEQELRIGLRERAERTAAPPPRYEDLRDRLRRRVRRRFTVSGVVVLALAAGTSGALTVRSHAVPVPSTTGGSATASDFPILGDEAGNPAYVSKARVELADSTHGKGDLAPVFVGHVDGDLVVVGAGTFEGAPETIVLNPAGSRVPLLQAGNRGSSLQYGLTTVDLTHGRHAELLIARPGTVGAQLSTTVTWSAGGVPKRSWQTLPMPGGYATVLVPPADQSLYRFRLVAHGVVLADSALSYDGAPSTVPPPTGLLNAMASAYGRPVSLTAVATVLRFAAPIAGTTDYAAWQPRIVWTGGSTAYGPDSALVQVRIRGGLLEGMAGSSRVQPVSLQPVPATAAGEPLYAAVESGEPRGGEGRIQVWAPAGAVAQTSGGSGVIGTAHLGAATVTSVPCGDLDSPAAGPVSLVVRDVAGHVLVGRGDITTLDSDWDVPSHGPAG